MGAQILLEGIMADTAGDLPGVDQILSRGAITPPVIAIVADAQLLSPSQSQPYAAFDLQEKDIRRAFRPGYDRGFVRNAFPRIDIRARVIRDKFTAVAATGNAG